MMKQEFEVVMLSLKKLEFGEFADEDERDAKLSFDIELEVNEMESQEVSPVLWNLTLNLRTLFKVQAIYLMYVAHDGENRLDKDELIGQTYYSILPEFSLLVSTLTKALGGTPLIIDSHRLMELAGYESE